MKTTQPVHKPKMFSSSQVYFRKVFEMLHPLQERKKWEIMVVDVKVFLLQKFSCWNHAAYIDLLTVSTSAITNREEVIIPRAHQSTL